jgi:hypothetical protein
MKIDLPSEAIEAIIIEELLWQLDNTKPNDKPPMYSYDPEVDKAKVRKLHKAIKRVLRYYGKDV